MGTIKVLKTNFMSKIFIICCFILVFSCIVGVNILAEEYDQENLNFRVNLLNL